MDSPAPVEVESVTTSHGPRVGGYYRENFVLNCFLSVFLLNDRLSRVRASVTVDSGLIPDRAKPTT